MQSDEMELRGLRRFVAALAKTRRLGLGWVVNRTRSEIQVPTSMPGRIARRVFFAVERMILRLRKILGLSGSQEKYEKILYVFVDLEVAALTFDAVTGLATAELYRRRRGLRSLYIVVVPGKTNGLKEEAADYASIVRPDARRWRIHNLLVPLFRLLPSCSGYTVCSSRDEAYDRFFTQAQHVFPEKYSVSFPVGCEKRDASDAARAGEAVLPMFRATPQALDYIRRFLSPRAEGRRVVVLNPVSYTHLTLPTIYSV